ncbi:MAG: hypothetical protein VCE43_04925, partial [Myxococcota bacterium]
MNTMRLLSRTSDLSMPSLLAAGVIVGTVMVVTYAPGTAIAQEDCDSESEELLCAGVETGSPMSKVEVDFTVSVTGTAGAGDIMMTFDYDTHDQEGARVLNASPPDLPPDT